MDAAPRHPGTVQLLRWFDYRHLPTDLGVVSMQFHHLAHELADRLPDSPELSVALRKLLEGKDAAVRAALDAGGVAADRPVVQQVTHSRMEQRLTVELQVPDGLTPEQLAQQVAREVAARIDRSAAEQSQLRVNGAPPGHLTAQEAALGLDGK